MTEVEQKAIEPEHLFEVVAEALKDPEKLKKLDKLPTEALIRTLRGVRNIALAVGADLAKYEVTRQVVMPDLPISASKKGMEAAVKRGMEGVTGKK